MGPRRARVRLRLSSSTIASSPAILWRIFPSTRPIGGRASAIASPRSSPIASTNSGTVINPTVGGRDALFVLLRYVSIVTDGLRFEQFRDIPKMQSPTGESLDDPRRTIPL